MFTLHIPETELFDENTQEFISTKETVLNLEHSLASMRAWEAKWEKPFLADDKKSAEEVKDYLRCMLVSRDKPEPPEECPELNFLQAPQIEAVMNYINKKSTATWFSDANKNKATGHGKGSIITAELIYYWMVALEIPFECQYWHLNQLLTLIRVCNEKNNPKKMSSADVLARNKKLNEARRKKYHTRG